MKKQSNGNFYRKKPKKNYYAVAIGRQPGIYRTWDECKTMVNRYPGAIFKGFRTHKEAVDFILVNKNTTDKRILESKHQTGKVHNPKDTESETDILIEAINRIGTF